MVTGTVIIVLNTTMLLLNATVTSIQSSMIYKELKRRDERY